MEPIAIPKSIDDPIHILLWSADEIVPFMVCMLTGMLVDHFISAPVMGAIAVKCYRRFRDNRPDGYTLPAVYWLGLLVVCVITSLAAWCTERSIILVPPTLTKEVEVTRTAASSEFKESWGLFLAELLGNTTPANADFLRETLFKFIRHCFKRPLKHA